jgi:transcriptional regulator with XRE-family HTH domain
MDTIAERVRWLREQTGMSARAVDALAHLTPGHTALIEGGHRSDPSSGTLTKLARALGVSLDWLSDGQGAPPSELQLRAVGRSTKAG